jgi:hypothetical protein
MANPTCPVDCGTPLPVHSFSDCAPEVNLSEIEWLLYTKASAPGITDIASVVEWTSRISNTSTSDNAIRQLRVTGDMPVPATQEIVISGQRRKVVDRTNTINADVDESNDTNHAGFRQLQCGGNFRIWFVTRSGHVFGGGTGIKDVSLTVNLVLGRGEQEIQKYLLVGTWKNLFMPERDLWALAGTTNSGSTIIFVYGTKAAGVPDADDIAGATEGSGLQDQDIIVPVGGLNPDPDAICFMAEPSTEPVKTVWYNTSINNGSIGAGETFLAPIIVGDWRVYYTAAATSFPTGTVQFRID